MNANSLILFQFGHLIWFKAPTAQMWEAKVKIIGLSRKKDPDRGELGLCRPPTSSSALLPCHKALISFPSLLANYPVSALISFYCWN